MTLDRTSAKSLPYPVLRGDRAASEEVAELVEFLDAYAVDQWATDPDLTHDLTYAHRGGVVLTGGAWVRIAAGTVTLADDATNYIERDPAGAVLVNQTAFTTSNYPMAKAVTRAGRIERLEDWRIFVLTTGGAGGGAPTDAEYLVGAAHAGLSAERVVTDTPTVQWDLGTAGQAKAFVPAGAVTPAAHNTSHQNGGSDQISIAGLSGLAADAQVPLPHGHLRGDLPAEIAYEDEANIFSEPQRIQQYLDFEQIATPAAPPTGRVRFFSRDQNGRTVMEFITDLGVTVRIGRDSLIIARNTTGGTLPAGRVVYIAGSTGQIPNFDTYIADGSVVEGRPLGVTMLESDNNNFTFVMQLGRVEGLNTAAFTEGERLYASATVAGELTNVAPDHPNLRVVVGVVARSHMTQGALIVQPISVRGDHVGTRLTEWRVGAGVPGPVDVVFVNDFLMRLRGNPTANRLLTLPNLDAVLEHEGHAAKHEAAGADPINVAGLSGILADQQDPLPHKTRHESGGLDEINVTFLSGLLADPQIPLAHAASHVTGADQIATFGAAARGLVPASGGGTDKFLRADGAFAVPPGGSGAADLRQVELAWGTQPTRSKSFVVAHAGLAPTDQVIMTQALDAPTGKAQDENEMDGFLARCVAGTDQFTAYIDSLVGPVVGAFKFNYVVG